jgi:hypothetical protein
MDQKTLADFMTKFPCAVLPDDEGQTAISCVVRLAFVHVAEKHRPKDSNNEPTYNLVGLLPAGADTSALKQIALTAWNKSPYAKTRGNPKFLPVKPQAANAEKYEGFGMGELYFDAKTKNAVKVFDAQMKDLPVDAIYSGCWARVKVRAYAYDKAGNWGVGFGLQAVQKIADDEKFAGGGNASDGFEAIGAPAGSGPAKMPAQSNGASALW